MVVSDALGSTTNTYDNLSRLVNVSNAAGQVQAVAYDVADRVTQTTDANGVSVTTTFENLDRLRTRTYPDTERGSLWLHGQNCRPDQLHQPALQGLELKKGSGMTNGIIVATGSKDYTESQP